MVRNLRALLRFGICLLRFVCIHYRGDGPRDTPRPLIHIHGFESVEDAIDAAKSGKLDDFLEYDTCCSYRKVNTSHVKES